MALSYVTYTGDGSSTDYNVTFDYISRSHVKVLIGGAYSTAFTWLSDTQIRMDSAPANLATVKVSRETPNTARLVDFQNGSTLNAEDDLDTDSNQLFFISQEAYDNNADAADGQLVNGSVNTVHMANSAITLAKMANLAERRVIARVSSGTGVPESSSPDDLKVIADGGSTERDLSLRFSEVVNAKDFGATGDGSTSDSTAINAALAAAVSSGAKMVFLPSGTYKITATLALAANVHLMGSNARTTKILKGFNGDMVTMADASQFKGIYLDGNGANYTGRGIVVAASSGGQKVLHSILKDTDGYVIEFADNLSGSRSLFLDCEIARYDGGSAGRYAVKVPTTATLTAVPRKFIGIESLGLKFLAIGGCNDLFIAQSFVGELLFDTNSRGVLIAGSRIGVNESAMNLAGFGVQLVGCAIAPSVTVLAGTTPWGICGCYCNGTITDNSASPNGNATISGVVYTPTLTGASANPTLGNGTIKGYWSRAGGQINLTVELTVGSTTNFNTSGVLRFSLPTTPVGATGVPAVQIGHGYVRQDSTATFDFVLPIVTFAVGYAVLQRSGAGGLQVTQLLPYALTTNDIIRFTITYTV